MKYKNNPFNIRSGSHWFGLVGIRNGFCEFETLDYGVRAACILLLQSYRKKGVCRLSSIVLRFAPSVENDTQSYLNYIVLTSGFSKNLILTSVMEYAKVLSCMAWFETHTRVSVSFILSVIKKYNISLFNL